MKKTLVGVFETKDFAVNAIRELMDENMDLSSISLAVNSEKKKDKIEVDPILEKDTDQHSESVHPKDQKEDPNKVLDYNLALGINTLGASYPYTFSSIGSVGTPYTAGGVVAAGPLFTSLSNSKSPNEKKMVDSLVSMGIPKEASKDLEQYILKGRYLVLMDLGEEMVDKVKATFWNSKALEVNDY